MELIEKYIITIKKVYLYHSLQSQGKQFDNSSRKNGTFLHLNFYILPKFPAHKNFLVGHYSLIRIPKIQTLTISISMIKTNKRNTYSLLGGKGKHRIILEDSL